MRKLLNNLAFCLRLTGRHQSKTVIPPAPPRKGTGRPLDDLAMISGKSRNEVRSHVKLCGIKYQDALKYYLFFNRLPDIDKAIVIRHFGVDNLIETVNKQIQN